MKMNLKKILSGAALGILLAATACSNNNATSDGASTGDQGSPLPGASAPKALHVVSSNPADGATSIALNATMNVTFDQEMDMASVNAHLHVLVFGVIGWFPVDGAIASADGKTFTFTPSASLKKGAIYSIKVDQTIQDKDGVTLDQEFHAGFTTPASLAVVSSTPADGDANVALNATMNVTFDQEMDSASVNAHFHVLVFGIIGWFPVDGAIASADGKTFTFTPSASLKKGAIYSIQIDQAIQDKDGVTLDKEFDAGFTS